MNFWFYLFYFISWDGNSSSKSITHTTQTIVECNEYAFELLIYYIRTCKTSHIFMNAIWYKIFCTSTPYCMTAWLNQIPKTIWSNWLAFSFLEYIFLLGHRIQNYHFWLACSDSTTVINHQINFGNDRPVGTKFIANFDYLRKDSATLKNCR